ncbi:ABC transporter substrate-binding protein [Paraburkholderia sp. CNPSo 3155]|uniref:ABC transporter substrate-binding protein n=1 Tax=Paraburkholderia atlantica TaxID=2654982 RepID=UPI00128B3401|nr:ABC transporter substrate-binding protein [Paraburkholderia atlantica]MPW11168.1 ABC transporter substrate-binding protein [Paraburkholderia atlantica]
MKTILNRASIRIAALTLLGTLGYAQLASADDTPIRIGLIMPRSGTFAGQGAKQFNGMHLALDEAGRKAGGHPLDIVEIDEPADSQLAVQKISELTAGSNRLDALVGIFNAQIGQALRNTLDSTQTITVLSNTNSRSLTGSRKSPFIFRVSSTSYTTSTSLADWVNKSKYCTSVSSIASNYSVGREFTQYFLNPYQAAGGKVNDQFWPALGTSDYSPYLVKMVANPPSCAFVFLNGPDAARFVQQFDQYGLKRKGVKLLGIAYLDRANLKALGQATVGAVTVSGWEATHPDPEGQAFATRYAAKYGEKPDNNAFLGYLGTKALIAAIKDAGGDVRDRKKFAETLKHVTFPAGDGYPFRFNQTNNTREIPPGIYTVIEPTPGTYDFRLLATMPPSSDPGDDVRP